MNKLLYGVAYYYEYLPYDRLEEDIKMMKVSQNLPGALTKSRKVSLIFPR